MKLKAASAAASQKNGSLDIEVANAEEGLLSALARSSSRGTIGVDAARSNK